MILRIFCVVYNTAMRIMVMSHFPTKIHLNWYGSNFNMNTHSLHNSPNELTWK